MLGRGQRHKIPLAVAITKKPSEVWGGGEDEVGGRSDGEDTRNRNPLNLSHRPKIRLKL